MTNQELRQLAAAVVLQTARDYKKHPEWRGSIENWVREGSLWLEVALPDYTENDIIGGFRQYAKEKN